MIQRKQSLYLLIAVAVIAVFLLADYTLAEGMGISAKHKCHYLITLQKSTIVSPAIKTHLNFGNIISLTISLFTSLGAIIMFKNLKLQSRLVVFNFLIISVAAIFIFIDLFQVMNSFDELLENHFSLGLILPFLLFLLNFLALRGIRKDIDILASADRLR